MKLFLCICCTGCVQILPAEAQLPKVDDLPPPALRGAGEVDAGGMELGGAEGGGLGRPSTQWHQQVPRGSKVPGKLQPHGVGGGALGRAAHINLQRCKYTQVTCGA